MVKRRKSAYAVKFGKCLRNLRGASGTQAKKMRHCHKAVKGGYIDW